MRAALLCVLFLSSSCCAVFGIGCPIELPAPEMAAMLREGNVAHDVADRAKNNQQLTGDAKNQIMALYDQVKARHNAALDVLGTSIIEGSDVNKEKAKAELVNAAESLAKDVAKIRKLAGEGSIGIAAVGPGWIADLVAAAAELWKKAKEVEQAHREAVAKDVRNRALPAWDKL